MFEFGLEYRGVCKIVAKKKMKGICCLIVLHLWIDSYSCKEKKKVKEIQMLVQCVQEEVIAQKQHTYTVVE